MFGCSETIFTNTVEEAYRVILNYHIVRMNKTEEERQRISREVEIFQTNLWANNEEAKSSLDYILSLLTKSERRNLRRLPAIRSLKIEIDSRAFVYSPSDKTLPKDERIILSSRGYFIEASPLFMVYTIENKTKGTYEFGIKIVDNPYDLISDDDTLTDFESDEEENARIARRRKNYDHHRACFLSYFNKLYGLCC